MRKRQQRSKANAGHRGPAHLVLHKVHKDPNVLAAIRKFDRVLADPAKAREFGLLSAGSPDAAGGPRHLKSDVLTCLAGRAMADILSPAIDAKW